MKDKIAIITLHSVKNYGSVLQAYATQCYFENMGLESVIIDYRRPWEVGKGYWLYLREKSLKGVVRNIMYFPSKIVQYIKFTRFTDRYLKLTPNKYVCFEDFKKYPVSASIYCTGSDQVWNSGWNNGVIPEYFLNFIDNKMKISFAASFGNSGISDQEKTIIEPLLKSYDLITVRESQSVNLLKKEFDINAYDILDPTLQMDGDFWKKMCRSERINKEKYVLLIQLNRNHEFDDLALKFSENKGIKLIRLCLRIDQIILPGKSIIIPEVEDYIRLIRDAEYILTDSFHAVSFCLNLKKQFFVYYPEKYSERLRNILCILNLKNKELKKNIDSDCSEIDYKLIEEILEKKRQELRTILKCKLIGENS